MVKKLCDEKVMWWKEKKVCKQKMSWQILWWNQYLLKNNSIVTKLQYDKYDKTQTQTLTKLRISNYDKIHNSNCDITQKLELWQTKNSNGDKT